MSAVAQWLRDQPDPLGKQLGPGQYTKVKAQSVARAYPPDERGLEEILYLDDKKRPHTAFRRGDALVYIVEGW